MLPCQCLVCNGRTTTSAARDRTSDPCKVSSNFEKHTVAPRRVFLGPKLACAAEGIEQCPSLRPKADKGLTAFSPKVQASRKSAGWSRGEVVIPTRADVMRR